MADTDDSPAEYRYNKLRTVGGSHRLTLVKAAADEAEVHVAPPRPRFAHIPVARGAWIAFDVDRYPSQRRRVEARAAASDVLGADGPVVGEYPVDLRGKVGSVVTLVPKGLVEALDLAVGDRITTRPVAAGALFFATENQVDAAGNDIAAAVERAAAVLAD